MEIIILPILIFIFLDVNRINVPLWQFVYLDDSYSLLYDIDDVYSLEEISWTGPNSTQDHTGTISSAEIEDEGIYRYSFVIMGAKNDSFTTTLYVLGKIMCYCNLYLESISPTLRVHVYCM